MALSRVGRLGASVLLSLIMTAGLASTALAIVSTSQTITFTSAAPTAATVDGATYTPTATATSGLTVAFTIDGTASAFCSITGGVVSFTGVGTCVIDANQAGNGTYAAAPQVQQSFSVKNGQTIVFGAAPTGVVVGGTGKAVSATATSGLPVTYTSATPLVCAVNSSTGALTLLAVGTCTIAANQAGGASFWAAVQVTQNVSVSQGSQTIVFGAAPTGVVVGGTGKAVSATASSGLPVTYTSATPLVCAVNSSTGALTLLAVGTCTIAANQAGNSNYSAATQAQQSIAVLAGTNQTISFTSAAPGGATVGGGTYTPTAIATSGLTVVFTIDAPAGSFCSISGGVVSFIGVGACVIDANQAGNGIYGAAPQVQQSFWVAAAPLAGTYFPLTPARLLDTRIGTGLSGKFIANTPRTFQVTGRGGVPSNATAVTGNLTVTGSTSGWAVFIGPNAIASPTSSTINFTAGQVVANGVTVGLSGTGALSATYISTTGTTTDLVFDVTGYFTPDTSGAYYFPLTPARLLDTRIGTGLSGKFIANTPRTFQVTGLGGVPSNATAVTGNLTVTGSTSGWAVFLGPNAIASPTSSTINFTAGQVVANGVTVGLSGTGALSATYISTTGTTTDLVFDVTGYFVPGLTSGARYMPLTPARLLDTRIGTGLSGKFIANTPRTFQVTGLGGVPSNATAVTGNLTVTGSTSGWAVFLGPNAIASPTSSTINFTAGQVVANGVTVGLSGTGALSATYISTTGTTTDLVFDVTGYFLH